MNGRLIRRGGIVVSLAWSCASAQGFELTFAADGLHGVPVFGRLGFTPSAMQGTASILTADRTTTLIEGVTTGLAYFVVEQGDAVPLVWGQTQPATYRLESTLFNSGYSQSTLTLGGQVGSGDTVSGSLTLTRHCRCDNLFVTSFSEKAFERFDGNYGSASLTREVFKVPDDDPVAPARWFTVSRQVIEFGLPVPEADAALMTLAGGAVVLATLAARRRRPH